MLAEQDDHYTGEGFFEKVRRAERLRPQWAIPATILGGKGTDREHLDWLDKALARASGPRERDWILRYRAGEDVAAIGREMRRKSKVINTIRQPSGPAPTVPDPALPKPPAKLS